MTWPDPGIPADRVPPLAVFPDRGVGLIQPAGVLRADAVLGAGYALASDPAWRPGFDEFWDLRAVEGLDFEKSDLKRFMTMESHVGGHLAGSRTLIVAPPSLKDTAWMVRAYARVARMFGREVYAHPSVEAALRDLAARGRPAGPVPTLTA